MSVQEPSSSRYEFQQATSSGLNHDTSEFIDSDQLLSAVDTEFNYYIVFRDGTHAYQGFYGTTGQIVEGGILTLTGFDKENTIRKLHLPLDVVKHWCEIGPGKRPRDPQS